VSYRGVRVLVLGATGFIGRHVAAKLAAGGATLTISSRDTVAPAAIEGAGYVACDVMRPDDVAQLFERAKPVITFNLAGYGVNPAERDEAIAGRINSELPMQLLELTSGAPRADWNGQVLVHAGSALEYGTAAGDLNENTMCTPTTLYGRTKLAGTVEIQQSGARALTARLFTVYGPGERQGRLLPALIECARTQTPLQLTDGRQLRDFTFVGDVADGLLRLGLAAAQPGEIVNLATGQLATVRSFAERAGAVLGMDPALLQFGALPTRSEEMTHAPVSITRLRELTAWSPPTSIEQGIRATIAR
jgi:UDP-glucose 4-epimerase